MKKQFNLKSIGQAISSFQKHFTAISEKLHMRREELDQEMSDRILSAYDFLNSLLAKDVDLFTPAGMHNLLELNHIVLCGTDAVTRTQYYNHLQETRSGFLKKVRPIKEWVIKKREKNDPWKVATGYYAKSLSQPQLFIEGNHRTGNIILNYLLISKDKPPFVISEHSAVEYLNLSTMIKFSNKNSALDSTLKFPGLRKKFHDFLKEKGNLDFLMH